MRHFGSSLFFAFAPVGAGVATRKRISAAALGSLLLGGALLPRSVGADVSIAGDWVGKGKCQAVDKLNSHSPVKFSEDVQLTFNSDANATSTRQVIMHGRFSTADFGAFQVIGALVGSNPPGADAFVAYFEADPPACTIPGPEDVLFGTVKNGKMKLRYVTSTSAAKFGTCTFTLKQTSTTASASPCP
jgi:hypothetical protein